MSALLQRLRRWWTGEPQPSPAPRDSAADFLDHVGRCADAAIAGRAKPCPACSGGHPGLIDASGFGHFVKCEECNGTGTVSPSVKACGSYECKAAQRDGVLCADGECDRENGVRPDGMPGSADGQPTACDSYRGLHRFSENCENCGRGWTEHWRPEAERNAGVEGRKP